MIARSTRGRVNVICLVGERGREVREFIERDLGAAPRALRGGRRHLRPARAGADQGGLRRPPRSPSTSATRASDVLLMMDSLTRASRWPSARSAWRSASRPPRAATRPACSRCCRGCWSAPAPATRGSITGALHRAGRGRRHERADGRRRALDPRRPHRARPRELAHRSHYPAIDVLAVGLPPGDASPPPRCRAAAGACARLLAAYRAKEDPDHHRRLPARRRPPGRLRDRELPAIDAFLRQGRGGEEPGRASAEVRRRAAGGADGRSAWGRFIRRPGGPITHGD